MHWKYCREFIFWPFNVHHIYSIAMHIDSYVIFHFRKINFTGQEFWQLQGLNNYGSLSLLLVFYWEYWWINKLVSCSLGGYKGVHLIRAWWYGFCRVFRCLPLGAGDRGLLEASQSDETCPSGLLSSNFGFLYIITQGFLYFTNWLIVSYMNTNLIYLFYSRLI